MKSVKNKKQSPVTTAEVKLMIVVSYYMILEIVYFVGSSQSSESQREFELYLECEQNGVDPDNPCSRSGFENPFGLGFFIVFYSMALLIPAVNFLFVLNLRVLMMNAKKLIKRPWNCTSK